MATRASIIQAAITRLGSEAPQSIDEDSDELAAVDRLYDAIVEDFLCRHAWTFATREAVLTAPTERDEDTEKPWTWQFAMPSDVMNVREVLREGVPAQYELRDGVLLARDDADLTLIYNWNASEERWPGDFAGGVQEELLGQLLEAFEEWTRGQQVRGIAERKLNRAMRRDRRQKPGRRAENPRLLRVFYNRQAGRV